MQGTHQDMHREHQQWVSEAALWQEEVELWHKQGDKALADLTRLETVLRQHARVLAEHAAAVKNQVERVRQHEHALADFEEGGRGDELLLLAKKHRAEAATHAQQRDAHRQIKQHHHAAMSAWNQVVKELAQAAGK